MLLDSESGLWIKLTDDGVTGEKQTHFILYQYLYVKEVEISGGFSSVQFSSVTQSCPTLCNPTEYRMTGFPVHHQHPEFTQTRVHWVGDAIQPSHPLSPPSPPALSLSQHQGLFQWVSSLHHVAKVLELISPSSEYSGLIFFRMDWFDLLAVQGTLKSLLQHHSSKAFSTLEILGWMKYTIILNCTFFSFLFF